MTEVRPAATVVVLRPRHEGDAAPELFMLRRSSKSAFMPDALVFPGGRVEEQDGTDDLAFARAARRETMEEASLDVAVERLRWFDTWKTPSGESPRRFVARFYLTTIAPDQGHDAIADGQETRAGRWADARTILGQWEAEQVDLPPPTLSILLALADGRWHEWSTRDPDVLHEPILPKVAAVGSQIHIVMPHDPEYAGLPGDTGPVPARVHTFPRRFAREGKRWIPLGVLMLALAGCKEPPSGGDAKQDGAPAAPATPEPGDTATPTPTPEATPTEPAAEAPRSDVDRLFAWMPAEPLAVAFDRLRKPFDPELLEVVFGIPPMAAHLLEERKTLDEALELVFEGDAVASNWLSPTCFAFTVAITKSPYYVRPLSKPPAEVEPLLTAGGFTKNTIEGIDVWLPSGSFPWRIALLGGDVAAFIPIDVPGAGLEPFSRAGERVASKVESELRAALGDDRSIELVLVASGPLIHYDVKQSIAQVQFALRGNGDVYEGQIVLGPTGDVDECANDLRAREHPEENQQIQALLKQVEFTVTEGMVLGRLELDRDRLQHLLLR